MGNKEGGGRSSKNGIKQNCCKKTSLSASKCKRQKVTKRIENKSVIFFLFPQSRNVHQSTFIEKYVWIKFRKEN